jgi:hypothetical protein
MTRFTPRRPSPALAVAAIALFVALGGTGYAATRGSVRVATAAKASKKSKPLTTGRVNQLIKQYVSSHLGSLAGPQGAAGPAGVAGAPGPAPIPVLGTGISTTATPQAIATIGPWSVTMTCAGGGSPGATLAIAGPGEELATTALGLTNGAAGATYESAGGPGTGVVSPGGQIAQEVFLVNGETAYELHYNLEATSSGPNTDCLVLGDAIEIS